MKDAETKLTNLKEGMHIELKEASKRVPSSFYETYSAFANSRGGSIYLGIKEGDDGNIITGISNPGEMSKAIISTLENPVKCSLNLLGEGDIILHDAMGKTVMEIRVKEAPTSKKPVYLNGSYNDSYKRQGDGDFRLKDEEIAYFINNRYERKLDSAVNSIGLGLDSIDKETLGNYRKRLSTFHPETDFSSFDDLALLKRIGAYIIDEDGKEGLTNGAILFFGKLPDILRIFPAYFVDYQRFGDAESDRWSKRITSDDFTMPGNIFSFFSALESEIKPYLPNPYRREGWSNVDGNDIYKAILEGVANAFSNAAYNLDEPTRFIQTPTSFTFHNGGIINVGINQAKQGGRSKPRNPTVFNFFRFIGAAEKAGLGIPTIFDVMRRYGYREPILREFEDREASELVISFLKLPEETAAKKSKEAILSYLSKHQDGASVSEIAAGTGISKTQTQTHISELLALGLVMDNGKKRKGRKIRLVL